MNLTLFSSELKRLDISIATLSEVPKPGSGEIMAGGYPYLLVRRYDGYHTQRVAKAASNKLIPIIIGQRVFHETEDSSLFW